MESANGNLGNYRMAMTQHYETVDHPHPSRKRFWLVMVDGFLHSNPPVKCWSKAEAVDAATHLAEKCLGEYVYVLEATQGYLVPKTETIDFVMVDS
jgi:hypothetical protein